MLRAVPVLLVLLSTACGLAEDERDEKNRYVYHPFYDKAFEAYCLEAFDLDGDGRISRYEAQRVRRIDCRERGIASLADLAEFTRLERLDCSGNRLTELDVTMTRLETLDCSGNALEKLDVNGLRGLRELDCRDNRLTNLGLGSNVSLTRLDGRANAFTTLDLRACSSVLQADLRDNPELATVHARTGQGIAADGNTEIRME